MADLPEIDLADSRPTFARTFENAASIVPLLSKPATPRFSPQLNARWIKNCKALGDHWSSTLGADPCAMRPMIISLLSLAIETNDPDCLQLSDTLASVADHLECHPLSNRLRAAVTATCEVLQDAEGLENMRLTERLRHCTQRLQQAMLISHKPGERSDVLDQIFVADSEERVERMHDALEALPIDIYALELESSELIQHAEQIEMWGIYHLARQLQSFVLQLSDVSEKAQDQAAQDIAQQLQRIKQALLAVDC